MSVHDLIGNARALPSTFRIGLAGSFTANQVDEFISRRRVPHLLLRVDLLPVDENIQRARGAGTQPNRSTELAFEIVLEAHGLRFQIASKEAAFDLDLHSYRSTRARTAPMNDSPR
jgi:hypothetical protein